MKIVLTMPTVLRLFNVSLMYPEVQRPMKLQGIVSVFSPLASTKRMQKHAAQQVFQTFCRRVLRLTVTGMTSLGLTS